MLKKKKSEIKENNNFEVAILNENSSFQVKEAYKTLRTNILFSLPKNLPSKVIAFVSACPGEGKTTTVINTAISFIELGKKIIVIDCDLRKPKLHKYMGIRAKSGLSNILGGFSELRECITKTEYGFDCITAGRIPPNPSELLVSEQFDETMESLKKEYDIILIDTPPITIVSETSTIVSKVDGTILIASSGKSAKTDFERAISILKFSNSKILGFVLNNSQNSNNSYGNTSYSRFFRKSPSYYYYNYGYGTNSSNNKYTDDNDIN